LHTTVTVVIILIIIFSKKIAVSKEHNVQAESLVIENISIKAGSKKGDGFACDILAIQFNATINGQKIEINYIAKYTPDGPRREMLKQVIYCVCQGLWSS